MRHGISHGVTVLRLDTMASPLQDINNKQRSPFFVSYPHKQSMRTNSYVQGDHSIFSVFLQKDPELQTTKLDIRQLSQEFCQEIFAVSSNIFVLLLQILYTFNN